MWEKESEEQKRRFEIWESWNQQITKHPKRWRAWTPQPSLNACTTNSWSFLSLQTLPSEQLQFWLWRGDGVKCWKREELLISSGPEGFRPHWKVIVKTRAWKNYSTSIEHDKKKWPWLNLRRVFGVLLIFTPRDLFLQPFEKGLLSSLLIFLLTIHPFVLSFLHFQSAFAYVSHKLRH